MFNLEPNGFTTTVAWMFLALVFFTISAMLYMIGIAMKNDEPVEHYGNHLGYCTFLLLHFLPIPLVYGWLVGRNDALFFIGMVFYAILFAVYLDNFEPYGR